MVQQAITMSSSLLLLMFMPRALGPVEYGRFYLAYSIAGMFQILVSFGANYQITKNVAREREQTSQIFVDAMALRSVLAVLSMAAIVFLGRLLNYPHEQVVVLDIFSLTLIVWAGINTLYACYQGHELLGYTSLGAIGERVFMSVVTLAVLAFGAQAKEISAVVIGSGLVNLVLLAFRARVIIPSLPRIRWDNVLRQVRQGVPYFLLSVFGVIYYRIDGVMLSKMSPEAVLGWYGGAHRLFESLNIPYQLSIAVYPVLARYWKDGTNVHLQTLQRSLELVVVIALPLTVGSMCFADRIIGMFYGLNAFGETVILFQILCAGLVFLFVDMILATTLIASDKQRQSMIISLAAIPLNIGINWFLIPYFQRTAGDGAIGATTATGITEIFVMAALLSILPAGLLKGLRWMVMLKGAAAAAAMAGAIAVLPQGIPWMLRLAMSTVVFAAAFWLSRPLPAGEDRFLREFFRTSLRSIGGRFRRPAPDPPVS